MSTRTRTIYFDIAGAGNFDVNGQQWDTATAPDMTGGFTVYTLPSFSIQIGAGVTLSFTQITVWQDGVISLGAPNAQQKAFMADYLGPQDLNQFPGYYISAGYTESGTAASDGNGDVGYGVRILTGEVDWADSGSASDPYNLANATPVIRIDWGTFDSFGDFTVDKQIVLTPTDFTIDDTTYDTKGAGVGIGNININGATQTIPPIIRFDANYLSAIPAVEPHNVAVFEGQTISGSSLFTLFNPGGDNITSYQFEDTGGGGHFVLNGVAQPDNQLIVVAEGQLGAIAYVAGSSPGADTLLVTAFDATTGASVAWGQLTATTILPATTVSIGPETTYLLGGENETITGTG